MDWIKKHYDQFALALLALALAAVSVMLILKSQGFGEAFAAATVTAPIRDKVPPLVLEPIAEAKKILAAPPQWNESDSRQVGTDELEKRGALFVSDLYILDQATGLPVKPGSGSIYKDTLSEKPIPNKWFVDRNLPLLDPAVPLQDPDKDGFKNEDEWREGTDPNAKDSHPAYHTKLFVKKFIAVPFRLVFKAYDGDPKKPQPAADGYQVNTVDLRQPSEYLKIGEKVANTKFKLVKFQYKTQLNPNTGEQDDISELTVENIETKELVVLVLNRITDSPDYFMDFVYKWPNPQKEFRVKKRQDFPLPPAGGTEKYNLVDSKEGKAVIQTPDGQKIDILPDPRK
jgi:hypothetical protein